VHNTLDDTARVRSREAAPDPAPPHPPYHGWCRSFPVHGRILLHGDNTQAVARVLVKRGGVTHGMTRIVNASRPVARSVSSCFSGGFPLPLNPLHEACCDASGAVSVARARTRHTPNHALVQSITPPSAGTASPITPCRPLTPHRTMRLTVLLARSCLCMPFPGTCIYGAFVSVPSSRASRASTLAPQWWSEVNRVPRCKKTQTSEQRGKGTAEDDAAEDPEDAAEDMQDDAALL